MEMLCNAIVRDDRGNSKDYKDGMWGDAEACTSLIKNSKWVTCSTAVVIDESMFAHCVPWYHETHQAVVHAMQGHMTLNQMAQRKWGDVHIVHVELANIKWNIVGINFIDIIDLVVYARFFPHALDFQHDP
jgi:hypothetical protein